MLAVGLLPLFAGAADPWLYTGAFYYENGVCKSQNKDNPVLTAASQMSVPVTKYSSYALTALSPKGLQLDDWVVLPSTKMSMGVFPSRAAISADDILARYTGYQVQIGWNDKFASYSTLYILPSFTWLEYTLYYEKNDGYSTHLKDAASPYIYTNDVTVAGCDWTRAGYDFAGWSLTPEGGSTTNFPGDVVKNAGEAFGATTNGVVNLYALWKPKEYDVTFSWQGRRGETNETQKVTHGEKSVAPALDIVNQYPGHTFDKWNGDTNATVTAAQTFTASYVPNHYWIVFDANGGEGVMNDEEMIYGEESALNTCMFTRKGCTFIGWALASDATEAQFKPGEKAKDLTSEPNGEVTLYAVWKLPEGLLDVAFNYRGETGEPLAVTNSVSFGGDATPPEDVDGWTGHRFVAWDGDYTNITEAVELNALYVTNVYTVRFDANGGEGEMADQDFLYDEPAALASNAFTRIVSDIAWRFDGWAVTADGDAVFADGATVTNLAVSGTNTLYATWKEPARFTVSVSSGSGGEVEPSGEDEYYEGTVIVLTATADEGYDFIGWNDGATGNPRSVIVLSNVAYTASFAVRSFEVVFNYRDQDGNAVATTNKVAYGSDATAPGDDVVDVWKGHRFTGWDGGYTDITTPTEVTAQYEELPPEPELGELAKAADANFNLETNAFGWCVDTLFHMKGESSVCFDSDVNSSGYGEITGIVSGVGTLSFRWRANRTIASDKTRGFHFYYRCGDEAETRIQDVPPNGEWGAVEIQLGCAGQQTVVKWSAWQYIASYFDEGEMAPAAWIDDITWTPAGSGPTEKDAPELSGFEAKDGGYELSVKISDTRFDYRLLASETLVPADWQPVGTAVPGTGDPLKFEIEVPDGKPQMFYKVEVLAK